MRKKCFNENFVSFRIYFIGLFDIILLTGIFTYFFMLIFLIIRLFLILENIDNSNPCNGNITLWRCFTELGQLHFAKQMVKMCRIIEVCLEIKEEAKALV